MRPSPQIKHKPKMNKTQTVGYVRVSSHDQNTDRQLDGIALDRIFVDKITGSSKDRPQLTAMIEYVRFGDTVIVHSLDRMARNLEDLLLIIGQLNQKGVIFKSLKENLSFDGSRSNPMDKFLLHVLGAVAEFNRALIREAQKEGIAKAKQQGKYKGRKPSLTPEQLQELQQMLHHKNSSVEAYKQLSLSKIAEHFNVSLPTINRYVAKLKAESRAG